MIVFVRIITCVEVVIESENLQLWIGAHVRAQEFFGAIPEVVVCDNLRSAFVYHKQKTVGRHSNP